MVTFIILHYLVFEETKKCVDSLLKLKGNKHIVIVDNCSPNDSKDKLEKEYKEHEEVSIIQNIENNGFAKGNNYGYEYIKDKIDSDFVVVMNNDMEILQEDFISNIYKIYDEEKFFVLAPDIFSTSMKIHQNPEKITMRTKESIEKELQKIEKSIKSEGKLKIKGVLYQIPYMMKIKSIIKRLKKSKDKDYLKRQYNVTLHGSCLIFSKLYLNKRSKLFFERTKFYCEAQILDYECERDNFLRLYDPSIKVLHHEDVSTNAAFETYLKKAQFMNNCMKESLIEFLKLLEKDKKNEHKKVDF